MSAKKYKSVSAICAAIVIALVLLCYSFISPDNIDNVFAFYNDDYVLKEAIDIGNIMLNNYD